MPPFVIKQELGEGAHKPDESIADDVSFMSVPANHWLHVQVTANKATI